MAKGDAADARTQISQSRQQYTPQLQQFTNSLYPQQQSNWQNFNAAGAMGLGDYNNIMGQYGSFLNYPGASYSRSPEMQHAMTGYGGFADTGGFSPQDIADMRARGIAPIRAAYGNAMANIDRQRALQGGYSPNYTAAVASMQRQLPQQLADAEQGVNANLAQMVQQGKLAGLQGLGGLSTADAQLALQAALSKSQLGLGALSGMSSLYAAQPGMARMFADQVDSSNRSLANSLGLTTDFVSGQNKLQSSLAEAPSDFDIAMGRIGSGVKMAGGALGGYQTGQTAGLW